MQTYGGTSTSVTSTGSGSVTVGGNTATATGPSGSVSITEKSYRGGAVGAITVNGGNGVTITTDGGAAVTVGQYSSTVNRVAAGAVSVTNKNTTTYLNSTDSFTVLGGTTVSYAANNTATSGAISVGASAVLNTAGTGLEAGTLAKDPTGNVTIVNGSVGNYGTSATNVYTNGAATVSITGAGTSTTNIVDAQSTLATAGAGVGKAIGTSALATVNLTGTSTQAAAIGSDALTNLNLTNISVSSTDKTITVTNNTVGHGLNVTLNNVTPAAGVTYYTKVVDDIATSMSVGTLGTVSDKIKLSGAALTSVTFNNTAGLTLAGLVMTTPIAASGSTAAVTDSVIANNTGALALGDLSGYIDGAGSGYLASINASGSTGAVSVMIDASKTTFAGGAGNDTVTIKTAGGITKAITGGGGTNTLIINAASAASLSGSTISGFTVLGMGTGANSDTGSASFDATGYSSLLVANTLTGDSTFSAVPANAILTQTASTSATSGTQKKVTITLLDATGTNDTVNLILGVDGTAVTGVNVGAAGYPSLIAPTSVENVTIASKGVATTGTNYVNVLDDALKTITITGGSGLTVGSQHVSSEVGVSTIDASGSSGVVDVSAVVLKTTGATITGGSGLLTASGGVTSTGADTITAGVGGVAATVGKGGAATSSIGYTSAWTAGSETINLAASAVRDTVIVGNATTLSHDTISYYAKVNGFAVANSGLTGDTLSFKSGTSGTTAQAKAVLGTSATPSTAGSGVESYTIANGIITFTPIGANSPTLVNQLEDARAIVSAANSNIDAVGAFVSGGDTYVIEAGHTYNSVASKADAVNVVILKGVALTTLGNVASSGSAVVSSGVTYTASSATSITANTAIDGTGYNAVSLGITGGSSSNLNSNGTIVTQTVSGLASSGQVVVAAGTGDYHVGDIVVNQTGAAGQNNVELSFAASNAGVVDHFTVSGDWAVKVNNGDSSHTAFVSSLIDSSAAQTLSTVYVNGGYAVELDQLTGTGLTTIDASALTGALTLGKAVGASNGPLGNSGIAVKASAGATVAYLSGASDSVTLNSLATANVGGGSFYLTGANDTVTAATAGTLQAALAIYASGSGDSIDVSKVTADTGKGLTIQGATSATAVGSNAIVKLGVGISALPQTVYAGVNTTVYGGSNYQTVDVTKPSAAWGTTSNITTIQLGTDTSGTPLTAYASTDKIQFDTASTITQLDVAQASSLTSALGIAASGSTASTVRLAWFVYGGDTYVYEHSATNAGTTLNSADIVVKIVGIHDMHTVSSGLVTIV